MGATCLLFKLKGTHLLTQDAHATRNFLATVSNANVFIPLQATATVPIPVGTRVFTASCGVGTMVAAIAFSSCTNSNGVDVIVAHK